MKKFFIFIIVFSQYCLYNVSVCSLTNIPLDILRILEDTHIGAIKQPRIKRDFCRDFYYHMEIPETYLNIIYA